MQSRRGRVRRFVGGCGTSRASATANAHAINTPNDYSPVFGEANIETVDRLRSSIILYSYWLFIILRGLYVNIDDATTVLIRGSI